MLDRIIHSVRAVWRWNRCGLIGLLLFTGLVLMPYHAAAAPARLVPVSLQNRQYYQLAAVGQRLGFRYQGSATRCELTNSGGGKMVFYPGKRFASVNGVLVTLDFAPVWRNGRAYLSVSDYNYLLNPLFNRAVLKGKRPRIIVIDPGHGGSDNGASGKNSTEKTLALAIAKKLQTRLQALGYRVYLTRSDDRRVELKQRAVIARSRSAQLFISIHLNASTNKTVSGVETYALTPPGAPSSSDSKPKSPSHHGNAMAANSSALAFSVQSQIMRRLSPKPNDRGMKRARFVVLTENSCASILVECGFISNSAEETRLRSSTYQTNLANAIADGVDRYCKRLSE